MEGMEEKMEEKEMDGTSKTEEKTVEKKTTIYRKLLQARMLFHSCSMKKSGYNSYSNFAYFELAEIVPTVINVCSQLGVVCVTSFGATEATLKFVDCDDPTQFIEFRSPVGACQLKACHEAQNIGASQTYTRRYLYMMAFDIIENDVLDSQAGAPGQAPRPTRQPQQRSQERRVEGGISREEAVKIVKGLKADGSDRFLAQAMAQMKIQSLGELKTREEVEFLEGLCRDLQQRLREGK